MRVKPTHEGGVVSQSTPPLPVGQVLEIGFPTFKPRITIRSKRELAVEIIAGDGVGFYDTVEYQAVAVRDDVVILSWQEYIGSTIVHVLDLSSFKTDTVVTPAKGGFLRLTVRLKSNLPTDRSVAGAGSFLTGSGRAASLVVPRHELSGPGSEVEAIEFLRSEREP